MDLKQNLFVGNLGVHFPLVLYICFNHGTKLTHCKSEIIIHYIRISLPCSKVCNHKTFDNSITGTQDFWNQNYFSASISSSIGAF